MRLVIFGPQGAGKGTQGKRIAEKWHIPAIATGDIFRDAIASESKLGREVKEIVESGQLVTDELTIELVKERLGQEDAVSGWLLDGFPRNTEQAQALDRLLTEEEGELDAALVLEVPEEVTMKRIMGRRVCSECGRNYHVDAPPQSDWSCDNCGGEVVQRPDDADEEAIRQRLKTYHEETEPLGEFYDDKGLLRRIVGVGSQNEVFQRIISAI